MASFEIVKSGLSPFLGFRSDFGRKLGSFPVGFDFTAFERKGFRLQSQSGRRSKVFTTRGIRVCCQLQEGENQSNGEEPPESLFMKELRRRGMTPTSLLEDSNRTIYGDEGVKLKEENGEFSKRNVVPTDLEKNISNQRERSMSLNSEGLEGLIPRAKLLLTIGGTFFLGFWPLILITAALFSALYLYFGSNFIHDARETPMIPPPYIDPYTLLEDERISQAAPRVD